MAFIQRTKAMVKCFFKISVGGVDKGEIVFDVGMLSFKLI